MKKPTADIVTPFDWQRFTAVAGATSAERAPKKSPRRAKSWTVKERVERILAHRWGNPYCKPGAA